MIVRRIFSGLIVLFFLLFTSQSCILSNYLECGKADCEDQDMTTLALFALLAQGSCKYPAEGSVAGTSSSDTGLYTSFTGRIDNSVWNETYIRRILHTFAYGGPVRDADLARWSQMAPEAAIVEILHVNPSHNQLAGSYSNAFAMIPESHTSLWCASEFLSTGASPLLPSERSEYSLDSTDALENTWIYLAQMRHTNPIRHKIGLFETNYHMAVSANIASNRSIFQYYDLIMNGIAKDREYQKVLADASVSAAVALQYNHRENVFVDAAFEGNEDFAREFHQLFFGILGTGTATTVDYSEGSEFWKHEHITIPNTAKALTDINVREISSDEYSEEIYFETDEHYPGSLEILGSTVSGQNAEQKIRNAAEIAVTNSESINNLPIILIRGLADDNLPEDPASTDLGLSTEEQNAINAKKTTIRAIWNETSPKNLLVFLRRYALSTAFYNDYRYKYLTSVDRNITITNLLYANNQEVAGQLYDPGTEIENEHISPFRPAHDVFGGQTGFEAASTPDIFKNSFNTSTENNRRFGPTGVQASWNAPVELEKDFVNMIPKSSDGTIRVQTAAEWLWNRLIGDGLANLGNLERAHLYALLGSGTDLSYFLSDDKTDTTINSKNYTWAEIDGDIALKQKVEGAGVSILRLSDADTEIRREHIRRVGMAVNFIISTPYMFARKGK